MGLYIDQQNLNNLKKIKSNKNYPNLKDKEKSLR